MNIEEFCKKYNFGKVYNISKLSGGLMHKMFKVETEKGIYCIKILNPEVMSRKDAYNNFVISESISNLAKNSGISVSSALSVNGNYLTEFCGKYYMVFNYVDGKVLKDDEITVEHCKRIGEVLYKIHSLNYENLNLLRNKPELTKINGWREYIKNSNFDKMPYKELYLKNYEKYDSLMERIIERYNSLDNNLTICHRDMDPKNVMWKNGNPIVIDWECAGFSNPYIELLEDALCWSGFLSDNFDKDKFSTVFKEYLKDSNEYDIDWFLIINCNLYGRFAWLKYNLDRSLGIITTDNDEISLAEKEVSKTINEINRYINLISTMLDIINNIVIKKQTRNDVIDKISKTNLLLENKKFNKINNGFTNESYDFDKYIVKICNNANNEVRFQNEIKFYEMNNNNPNIPKLYFYDVSKKIVPYYYEIIEKVPGNTLYEVWYKFDDKKRKDVIKLIIDVLRSFHKIKMEDNNFLEFIKNSLNGLIAKCKINDANFLKLLELCNTYFKDNDYRMIHGDLHFDNFLYDGNKLYLIDFETSKSSPIDYDFRIFNRYSEQPYRWASEKTDMLTVPSDYKKFMDLIIENYQELKNIKYLNERLSVYDIIELLETYYNTNNSYYLKIAKEQTKKLIKEY